MWKRGSENLLKKPKKLRRIRRGLSLFYINTETKLLDNMKHILSEPVCSELTRWMIKHDCFRGQGFLCYRRLEAFFDEFGLRDPDKNADVRKFL